MDRVALPLLTTLRLNGRLFENCFADVEDAVARRSPCAGANSMSRVGLHTVDARCHLAQYTGARVDNPFARFESVTEVQDPSDLPSVTELLAAWKTLSAPLEHGIVTLSCNAWAEPSSLKFPIDDLTVLGGVAFLVQHESYHIGQLAYLRRLLGLKAMRYA